MNNTSTYKQTPIGLIPTDWGAKQLGDICEIFLGLTYTPEYTSEGVPFLSVKDINGGVINFSKTRFISESEFKNSTKNAKPQKGDILFGRVGTLGNPILIEENIDFCIFVSLGYLRLKKENFDRNFLIHWMWSDIFTKQVDSEVSGSSQKNLNTGWLKKFLLTNPPILEQQKIAAILSTWDNAINNCTATLKALSRRKQWLANELLFKSHLLFKSEKSKEQSLLKLVDRVKHSFVPEPNKLYKQIGIRSHCKGIFFKEEVTGKTLGNKSVFHIEPDCFIVNIVFAWEHAIAKTTTNEIGMIASHRFPMYKPKEGILDLNYMLHFFKSKKGKDLLELASPGGAGRNKTLGQSEFLKLQIPVPSFQRQQLIAEILDKADYEITLYQQKLEQLKQQKKGLMQQLLTGKTRVKVD